MLVVFNDQLEFKVRSATKPKCPSTVRMVGPTPHFPALGSFWYSLSILGPLANIISTYPTSTPFSAQNYPQHLGCVKSPTNDRHDSKKVSRKHGTPCQQSNFAVNLTAYYLPMMFMISLISYFRIHAKSMCLSCVIF